MGPIGTIIDFVLHIDSYLNIIIQNFGAFSYLILFAIIFLETGLVITPFLPGDSLIFVAGTFASSGSFNVILLFFVLCIAAILGDTVNYSIGRYFGKKVFENSRLFKKEYLVKTEQFYHKHGGKTIIYARFMPFIRTFAPFVAGVAKMDYLRFLSYNVIGGIVWVALFLFGGFFFGSIPVVKENLTLLIYSIIFVSILPPIFEYLKHKMRSRKANS